MYGHGFKPVPEFQPEFIGKADVIHRRQQLRQPNSPRRFVYSKRQMLAEQAVFATRGAKAGRPTGRLDDEIRGLSHGGRQALRVAREQMIDR